MERPARGFDRIGPVQRLEPTAFPVGANKGRAVPGVDGLDVAARQADSLIRRSTRLSVATRSLCLALSLAFAQGSPHAQSEGRDFVIRSEERRVGKECRSRGAA